jgi:streptomycin 6-kinase
LPSAIDKAHWLAGYITASWDELGQPCRREVVDQAVDFCSQRAAAFDASQAVLVHGDTHGWNTLDAGDGMFKFPGGPPRRRARSVLQTRTNP